MSDPIARPSRERTTPKPSAAAFEGIDTKAPTPSANDDGKPMAEEDEQDWLWDVEKDIWTPMPPRNEYTVTVLVTSWERGQPNPLPDDLLERVEGDDELAEP